MPVKLPSDIVSLEEEPEFIQVMVHGDSGSGKTPFGASSRKGLILATENRASLVSAKRRGSQSKVWPCRTWTEFLKAKTWLEKAGETPSGIPFDWVTIDSATNLQQIHLRHILNTEYASSPSKRDIDLPQLQDHQKWQNEFKRTMQELTDLPVNLCAIALPMVVEVVDDTGDVEEWTIPAFDGKGGKIAWFVCGLFSAGGRISLVRNKEGKVVQRIDWQKVGTHWGRDRYAALGEKTYNLTLDGLARKVQESRTAS